jgi:AraC-like DNA-binding protein
MAALEWDMFAGRRPFHALLLESREPVPVHEHRYHELMHIVEGYGVHTVNGEKLALEQGQTWYLGPTDCHAISPEGVLTWINVAVTDSAWQAFRVLTSLGEPERLRVTPSQAPFEAAVRAYLGEEDSCALPTFLIEVFAPVTVQPRCPEWLCRALLTLDDQPGLRGGIKHLQQVASVSPAHLSRCVRAAFGISPTRLVNERRLDRCALLLAEGRLSISEIASDCGFDSLSYFCRIFRTRFGETPSMYRKRGRKPISRAIGSRPTPTPFRGGFLMRD